MLLFFSVMEFEEAEREKKDLNVVERERCMGRSSIESV